MPQCPNCNDTSRLPTTGSSHHPQRNDGISLSLSLSPNRDQLLIASPSPVTNSIVQRQLLLLPYNLINPSLCLLLHQRRDQGLDVKVGVVQV
jgi:hypothetical protein